MSRAVPLLTIALLLGACGGRQDGAGNNSSDGDVPPPAAQEQTDANLTLDNQNSVVPLTLPSPRPLAGLPPAYAGRWGMTPGDCAPATATSDGLLTIAGDTLSVAGARGAIAGVIAVAPGRITGTIDQDNGGDQRRRPVALTLIDQGRTLIREEQDPAASFRYSRCPTD